MPLERTILEVTQASKARGQQEFYAYQMAARIAMRGGIRSGALYRALRRLEAMGYVTSRWETPALEGSRPRRRYYALTEDK